jgi:hypothetical protein
MTKDFMSTDIERLLFYERQYLQSFDFTAEQNYHLEMRRRLNLALHLWGIVYGLELMEGEVVPGAPEQFYVSEGMAIDAYGREIVLSAKHLLSNDIREIRMTGEGVYTAWIGYRREPAGIPKVGFRQGDSATQFSRWKESFEILIVRSSVEPNPRERPDSVGSLSDDPKEFPSWMRLGTLMVNASGAITNVKNDGRSYIGVRAQRIVAPRDVIGNFDVLQGNSALDPLTSIALKDNVFVEQNLIAGKDFKVEPDHIKPAPSKPFPSLTGNVKVANDLFLQGNLYTHGDPASPGLWSSLDECIQRQIRNLIPEFHIGATKAPLTFPVASSVDATGSLIASVDVIVTTLLTKVASVSVIASLAGIQYKPRSFIGVHPSTPPRLPVPGGEAAKEVSSFHLETNGKIALESDKNYRVTLTCTAGPAQQISTNPVAYEVPIESVLISYMVIFYPSV